MSIRKKVLYSLFALIAFGGYARAQDSTRLTLKDALNYALENYADARKAKLDIENAAYQIDEVKSRALPQLSGTGGLNYNPLLQKSALPGELNPVNPGQTLLVAFGQKWNANIGVGLTQNLFDQSVFTGLKAAKTTREFYQLNSQLTEEKVIEQVASSYYQVYVQRQQIVNIDSNINTTKEVYKVIRGQYENGLGKKIDVNRIEVKLSNLNSQRLQLLNVQSLYENQLKFFIGMPVTTPIEIPAWNQEDKVVYALDMPDTLDLSARTEMKVLDKQQHLLDFKKQSVKAEYYPTVSLSGNYSYQGLANTFPVFKGASKGSNWFDVSTIGLNLKVPLFNGRATRSRVKQADVEIRKLQEDIALTRQSLNLDYENAKTQIKNAIINMGNQRKNIELAQSVFENTQNNYHQGLAPLTDLLDAQSALFDAQNAYNISQLDYRTAEIKLLKARGELKTLIN
jgi:outer membrane protein TolC